MAFHTPKQTPGLQYALAIVLTIGPTIFTALRFRARFIKKAKLDWDDWLIVVALSWALRWDIMANGAPVLSDPGYTWFLKMLYAGQLSQIFAIGPTKVSVLLFYRRIFRGPLFNIANWTLIALVSIWIIGFFFANLLECIPISRAFTNAPGMGGDPQCINAVPMYLSQVYSDVALDVLVLAIPIPLVWKLQLPTKQKFAVLGIFLLGIMLVPLTDLFQYPADSLSTVLASCAKMIIFNFVGHELAQQADISYFLSPITYWPLIEAALQIVAACLTMLRPFFEDWRLIIWDAPERRGTGYLKSSTSSSVAQHHLSAAEDGMIYKRSDVLVEIEPRGADERVGVGEWGALDVELRRLG